MTRPNTLSVFFVAALVFLNLSCRREKNYTFQAAPKAATIDAFYEVYGPQRQTFKIDADNPQEIKLSGGSAIRFQKNAFTINGKPVTGELTVEAYEVLKRSDMLLSGTNTNYIDGRLLDSRGFLYINVKSNGVEVDEDLKMPVYISVPWWQNFGGSAMLFRGNENSNGTGQFAWEFPADSNGVDTNYTEFFLGTNSFSWLKLKWVNCDLFYNAPGDKTVVRVRIENSQWEMRGANASKPGNGFVSFCPKGYNSMLQLWNTNGANIIFSDDEVPAGVTGKLLLLMVKDSVYYFAQKEIVVQSDQSSQIISLTGTPISADDLKKEVAKLDSY